MRGGWRMDDRNGWGKYLLFMFYASCFMIFLWDFFVHSWVFSFVSRYLFYEAF